MITDITIIGGGPAGAASAISLARSGLSVVLLEKARMPRDKYCGDGLTAGALRLLEHLELRPSALSSWQAASQVTIRSPKGRVVTYPFPSNARRCAAVAERRQLDAALLALARDAGAEVYDDCASRGISLHPDRVEVRAEGLGVVSSRYVVAADGMWSPTRRMLGLSPPAYKGDWHAFRQYYRGVRPEASETLFVWFEPEILPGYVWSFPLPGRRANVGFGIWRGNRSTKGMNHLWRELIKRPHIASALGAQAEPEDRHRAWPIPTRLGDLPLWAHRVLFCGDAGAVGDPMTGEGIGQALLSGMLAAGALISKGPFDIDGVRNAYLGRVDRHLKEDHRLARRLGKVMLSSTGIDLAMAISGITPFTRREFALWLFEDYPRALLFTPERWSFGYPPALPPGVSGSRRMPEAEAAASVAGQRLYFGR